LPSSNFGEKQDDKQMTSNQHRKANCFIIRYTSIDPHRSDPFPEIDGIICEATAAM
jgi:hypothetical protein